MKRAAGYLLPFLLLAPLAPHTAIAAEEGRCTQGTSGDDEIHCSSYDDMYRETPETT